MVSILSFGVRLWETEVFYVKYFTITYKLYNLFHKKGRDYEIS